jgi:hypothetical protein
VVGAPASPANLTGFGLTVAHLVIGAAYWAAKLVQIRQGRARPPGIARFDTVRRVLVGLLVVGLVLIVAVALTAAPADWLAGAVLLVVAAAEHVNYFHWQLMHDNPADLRRLFRMRRLSRSHLRSEVEPGRR